MNKRYNYRNCQSLFGYAQDVHKRSGGICQLCGAGMGEPSSFDLWRQLTVEHLVGASQGGYIKEIRVAISKRFPGLSNEEREELALRIDRANTATACSFCNATTSRDRNPKNMAQLISEAKGEPDAAEGFELASLFICETPIQRSSYSAPTISAYAYLQGNRVSH